MLRINKKEPKFVIILVYNIVLEGKNRLTAEATQLSVQVQSELKELLLAKEYKNI